MRDDVIIRPLREDETDLLEEFLYLAVFVPEGMAPPPKDIVMKPELRVYLDDFGSRHGDNCLAAVHEQEVIGAVWTRIMNDYGHIDDETPSFAISVREEYRSQGIGTELMKRMLALLRDQGFRRASLAVQKANYAFRMYRDTGFEIIGENDEEYIMACELDSRG